MSQRLKLSARDPEDMEVISAALQDAIFLVGEMRYLPTRRQFVAVVNRFMWELDQENKEAPHEGEQIYYRVKTGIHFDGVLKVRSQNIRKEQNDAVVELLALEFQSGEDGAGTISLIFAGGGTICLEVECIEANLSDISAPWPTANRPTHEGVA